VWIIFGTALKDVNAPFRLMKVERLRRYLPLIPDDYFLPNALLSIMIAKIMKKCPGGKFRLSRGRREILPFL